MYHNSSAHIANMMAARELSFAAMAEQKAKRIAAYLEAPKLCAECGAVLPYEKRTNRFCARSCSATWSNKQKANTGAYHSAEAKARIAASVREAFEQKAKTTHGPWFCANCGVEFLPEKKRKRAKYCSLHCSREAARKYRNSADYRAKLSEFGKENVARQMKKGTWKGWPVRQGPSFPEKYVQGALESAGLSFVSELQVGRFSIDIAFPSCMVAVEVDGRQHETISQKEHDKLRDAFLQQLGWTVVRIKWHSIKNESGLKKVSDQIAELIGFLKIQRGVG